EDRNKAIEIIKQVNNTLANKYGLSLKPITWEDVTPGMGRPEQVILDQINMGNIDIFVGIMWKRFGSPTGEIYESGTQEEFHVAYDEWKVKGRPRIMFYFNTISDSLPTNNEIAQYKKVLDFKNAISEKGLCKEYKGSQNFYKTFQQDLMHVITNWKNKEPYEVEPQLSEPIKAKWNYYKIWRDSFTGKRQPGERVESFIYRSAKNIVKFMTISGRSIFSSKVEEALQSRCDDFRLRILLYDWNAPHFAIKMHDERRATESEIERARSKAKEIARQFIDIGNQYPFNLEIRLYDEYPVWRMMLVDDETAYIGYYPKDKRGYEGPMFIFKRDEQGSLFYPMNQYFDKVWEKSGASLADDDPRLR
ncbi:MAG: hypothetical protein JSW07_07475, partial [bacterium]